MCRGKEKLTKVVHQQDSRFPKNNNNNSNNKKLLKQRRETTTKINCRICAFRRMKFLAILACSQYVQQLFGVNIGLTHDKVEEID